MENLLIIGGAFIAIIILFSGALIFTQGGQAPTSTTTTFQTTTTILGGGGGSGGGGGTTITSTVTSTTVTVSTIATTTIGCLVLCNQPQSMTNLVTWSQPNQINYKSLNEISIFRLTINSDCSIGYDGGLSNLQAIINTAHQNGAKVSVAFGGSTLSTTIMNKVLSNSTCRSMVINAMVNEMRSKSYDSFQADFENSIPGDFSSVQYTQFIKQLYTACGNCAISVTYAPWESQSISPGALEPYVTHILIMFNPTSGQIATVASQLKNKNKISIGYDLSPGDTNVYHIPSLQELQVDYATGYGVFFWNLNLMNQQIFNNLITAGYT